MKTPEKFLFAIIGAPESKKWVPALCNEDQTDILFCATTGLAPGGEYRTRKLPEVSFQIIVQPRQALITVVRGYDFLAEAAVVCPDTGLLLDLLADYLALTLSEDSLLRADIHKALLTLQPPSCLMAWKRIAAYRLTMEEHQLVVAEIESLAGAVVAALMANLNDEVGI